MNQTILNNYLPYILFAAGLLLIVISIFFKSERSKLTQTELVAEGIVFEQSDNSGFTLSSDEFSSGNSKVTIRFVTQKGEWITGPIHQDFQISYSGQYKNGDRVTVYYDPNNPSYFYVDTKQSESTARGVLAISGLVVIIVGLYKLFV